MSFTKLSALVGDDFTIKEIKGMSYKKWNPATNKPETSQEPQKGFAKKYSLDTDKGLLDLGAGQMGNILEACLKDGVADLNGKTIAVKSNGKTGMEIRYFFNLT